MAAQALSRGGERVPDSSLFDQIFETSKLEAKVRGPGHPTASLKTYRYLRIAMMAVVAALAYSVVTEWRRDHCLLDAISLYYYTPARPVFIGAMVAIGVALLAVKGKTPIEDICLSLAGMMAPLVAFIPTDDDPTNACRNQLVQVVNGVAPTDKYQVPDQGFNGNQISNNLHALIFAAWVAVVILILAFVIDRLLDRHEEWGITKGTKINFGIGAVLVVVGTFLVLFAYDWVLGVHGDAAAAMFGLLAVAAVSNWWVWHRATRDGQNDHGDDDVLENHIRAEAGGDRPGPKTLAAIERWCAWIYLVVGVVMALVGIFYLFFQHASWAPTDTVLYVEGIEILLFFVYWAVQTVERWDRTV
jgi:hypothetical protein